MFQYRPYYLNQNGHQLSYDIYIPKIKTAIEYQGQQHFEPIDYFGGQKSFEAQKSRDELKRQLSKANHVKLIYINYWDSLSIDLIKNKINGVNL